MNLKEGQKNLYFVNFTPEAKANKPIFQGFFILDAITEDEYLDFISSDVPRPEMHNFLEEFKKNIKKMERILPINPHNSTPKQNMTKKIKSPLY